MATTTVRPARAADVSLVHALIGELAEYERLAHAMVATPDDLQATLFGDRPSAEVLIGELDGRGVGFALYFQNYSTFLGKPGLYLEDLFVRPEARGRGVGRALFLSVARRAVDRGCGRMEWSVLDWNQPAIDFYRAQGAIAMDEWTTFRLHGAALQAAGTRGS
ncbi:MAG: GNAT family N-acetyltransferase [Myxococcales bacterium]|nr:GNAT family N-acetyltransferase [Myxococcales bacterium]